MNRRGFTLIELLATLVVLGIITGIVLVSSTSLFKDKKSDTEDVFVDTLKDILHLNNVEKMNIIHTNLEILYHQKIEFIYYLLNKLNLSYILSMKSTKIKSS